EDPAPQDDAPLARARVRAEILASALPGRPVAMGFLRAPARALPRHDGHRDACPGRVWPPARPFPHAAARLRLDPGARHAGAGGTELSEPVGGEGASFDSRRFAARLRLKVM